MKKIRALIVEDEPEASKLLQLQLDEHCSQIKIIDCANSVSEGLVKAVQNNFELMFLDVDLGDGKGFDLLSQLDEINFKIIFVTAFGDYALDAFKAEAVDYLLKPVDPLELVKAVEKVEKQLSQNFEQQLTKITNVISKTNISDIISLHEHGRISFINAKDIVYLMADGQYTKFILKNGDVKFASMNIGFFEKMKALDKFFRIHRSALINLIFVEGLDTTNHIIVMKNSDTLPFSHTRKKEFLKLMEHL